MTKKAATRINPKISSSDFPALVAERERMYASRLIAAQSIPEVIRNSNAKGGYSTPNWNVRPGADDHLQCKSKGPV